MLAAYIEQHVGRKEGYLNSIMGAAADLLLFPDASDERLHDKVGNGVLRECHQVPSEAAVVHDFAQPERRCLHYHLRHTDMFHSSAAHKYPVPSYTNMCQ